jgi:GNAT superfamily N-acetyltransferase
MTIERVDPSALDEETAAQLADVMNASVRADGGDFPPQNAATILGQLRHGNDDQPTDVVWVARDGNGTPVAMAELELTHYDNPDLALVFCDVHPDHRGRGIGTALLEQQIAEATATGRRKLLTFQLRDGASVPLLTSRGFVAGMYNAQRRLDLPALDYAHIEELHGKAAAAAHDYETVRLDGPTPEELRPGLVGLHEAINDAPMDDIDIEPEVFPVERTIAWEKSLAHRNQHLYRVLVRHRETGAWAGHTVLAVDRHRPGVAHQEDTSVVVSHRGHRLGMLLKTAMLLWMREAEPQLKTIDTWNAESNSHMIAVNDELGCRVSNRSVALQLTLGEPS